MAEPERFEFEVLGQRFRPTLVPTLFTVFAVLAMLGLGTWQVQRLHWKEALIAERQSRAAAAAIAAPDSAADLDALAFRRVRVKGRFLHEREMYLAARSLNGNLGYHIVTPLQEAEGRSVLVDRGWVPLDRKLPETRREGQLQGEIEVEGLIRRDGRPGFMVPDNRPAENFWFYVDIPAMAAHAGVSGVRPYYVEAGPAENPGGLPIGGQTRLRLPNDHLSYAITWYSLAVALVVIYLVYHRVKPE